MDTTLITTFQSPRYIQQLIIERRIRCCLCAVFRQSAAEKLQEMITAISSNSATRPLISLQPRHWTLDTWAELTNNIPRNTPHSHPGFPLCQPIPAQLSAVQATQLIDPLPLALHLPGGVIIIIMCKIFYITTIHLLCEKMLDGYILPNLPRILAAVPVCSSSSPDRQLGWAGLGWADPQLEDGSSQPPAGDEATVIQCWLGEYLLCRYISIYVIIIVSIFAYNLSVRTLCKMFRHLEVLSELDTVKIDKLSKLFLCYI